MFYFKGKACSALLIAAYRGYKDIAELLIASGASVHVVDDSGETPLHKASSKGHRDVVELLIVNGAQIDPKTKDGCTPLYLAAFSQHKDITQLLLGHGAAMELDIAVMLGDIESIGHYLSKGVDANSKLAKGYAKGNSFLNQAVRHQYRDLVKLLLNHGARVNEKTGTFGSSPLHEAAMGIGGKAYQDICELLIAHGADVNSEDKHGETPLHRAAQNGHLNIVKLLLDCGANVNSLNLSRRSALFEAARLHHQQVVKFLLSRGADINLTDERGFTPLLCAFQQSGGDEIVRVLVNYGADVNVRDSNGVSLLHIAVAQVNKNIVEFLLTHGAQEGLE
jgi:ankyrin repeat protein